MKYLSGTHALNTNCKLETCGDWHQSAINWSVAENRLRESENSLWGDYGIECNQVIPYHKEYYNVANHIRACLDLLYEEKFSEAQGMNNDFICNKKYDSEIFEKVYEMQNMKSWEKINRFMEKEYLWKWKEFVNGKIKL